VKHLLPLLCLLALAGCVTVPPAPPLPAGTSSDNWILAGRIAVRAGDQGWHAGLLWHERADRYDLRLEGPLGQGAAELTGRPGRVTLRTADGKRYQAASPEQLLVRVMGVRMPVSGLRYWVRGRPAPGPVTGEQRDKAGHLTVLVQDGWVIHYEGYSRVRGRALPARMRLANGDVRVRLIVDRWENGGGAASTAGSR